MIDGGSRFEGYRAAFRKDRWESVGGSVVDQNSLDSFGVIDGMHIRFPSKVQNSRGVKGVVRLIECSPWTIESY